MTPLGLELKLLKGMKKRLETDRRIPYAEGKIISKILDNVEKRLKPRKLSHEVRVSKTKKQLEYDKIKKLSEDYHNYILWTFWYVKDLGNYGVAEPPKGDGSQLAKVAHDHYMAMFRVDPLKPRKDSLRKAEDKLQNVHNDFMRKIRKNKDDRIREK